MDWALAVIAGAVAYVGWQLGQIVKELSSIRFILNEWRKAKAPQDWDFDD